MNHIKSEPARLLYEVIRSEAEKRSKRTVEQWREAEILAVWSRAKDYAQQYGLQVLTLKEIKVAEQCACGHVDYAAKWAHGVAHRLLSQSSKGGS